MKKYIYLLGFLVFLLACEKSDSIISIPKIAAVNQPDFEDSRDGQSYRCLKIGNQTWMIDNLKYRMPQGGLDGCFTYGEELVNILSVEVDKKAYADAVTQAVENGEIVDDPSLQPAQQPIRIINTFKNLVPASNLLSRMTHAPAAYKVMKRIYDDLLIVATIDAANLMRDKADQRNGGYSQKYGYLYTFKAAQLAAPKGWRLPTDADWKILEEALGMPKEQIDLLDEWRGTYEGGLLKKETDESGMGFETKLGGARIFGTVMYGSRYINKGLGGYFWSSSEVNLNDSTTVGITRSVMFDRDAILRGTSNKQAAYHLRLIKE